MSIDTRSAYEILGLKEDATRAEIENKYYVLLKKYRSFVNEENVQSNSEVTLEQVTEAYNHLMGYEKKEIVMNREEKVHHFFYYHKVHIIIGLLSALLVGYFIYTIVTREKFDMNVAVYGLYKADGIDKIELDLEKLVPEVKNIGMNPVMLTDKVNSEQSMAETQKAMVLIAAGDIDVFLLDKYSYDIYAKQGAFIEMDSLMKELNQDEAKNIDLRVKKTDGDNVEHYYGIDVSDNQYFKDKRLFADKTILAVRVNAKHHDFAVALVKKLLEKK